MTDPVSLTLSAEDCAALTACLIFSGRNLQQASYHTQADLCFDLAETFEEEAAEALDRAGPVTDAKDLAGIYFSVRTDQEEWAACLAALETGARFTSSDRYREQYQRISHSLTSQALEASPPLVTLTPAEA
jgi:hypothetical protein